MSEYARVSLSLEVSANSDYSAPYVKPAIPSYALTPTEGPGVQTIYATTAGGSANTVSLATLTSGTKALFIGWNTDTTNYVSITCRLMGDADDAVLRVSAGAPWCVEIDPTTSLIFQANTASVLCRFAVLQ